jgi:MinD-like ATPase involved in chromosome partitioning or flagellar assembly
VNGAGFHPTKRRRPEPTDWEELEALDGHSPDPLGPAADLVPVCAEVVALATPGRAPDGRATRSLVAVVGARGGCGRTTVAALLASTLGAQRAERVTAVDTVPEVGDLAERLGRPVAVPAGPGDLGALLGADGIVVVDGPAGARQAPLPAVLGAADQLVVLAAPDPWSGRRDVRLLDWLDVNGHDGLVRRAVAVLNERACPAPRSPRSLRSLDPLAEHLAQRCRAVVRLPADGHLAAAGPIELARLGRGADRARLELAAAVAAALDDDDRDPVNELVEEVQLAAMTVPGYLGAAVEAPSADRPVWRVALAFAGHRQLAAWRSSPARARWYDEASRDSATGAARALSPVRH